VGLSAYDAATLTGSRELANYFEAVVAGLTKPDAKLAANWVMGDLSATLNKENLDVAASRISAAQLAGLLARIQDGTLSGKLAKQVFEAMWTEGGEADGIIEAKGLKQVSDSGAMRRSSTKSWPPTPSRWRNSVPARKRRSTPWSARS
jgi:aspartyl-tRNA(Asn)/glutamyl-tRNA(Gln) amidotransferase subunit B